MNTPTQIDIPVFNTWTASIISGFTLEWIGNENTYITDNFDNKFFSKDVDLQLAANVFNFCLLDN